LVLQVRRPNFGIPRQTLEWKIKAINIDQLAFRVR